MKPLVMIILLTGLAHAEAEQPKLGNVIEESHLDPTVEKAKMPGTREAIDNVNTSPNPVPQAEDYDYNEVLIDGKYIQDQSYEKKNNPKQSQEDNSEE